MIFLCVSLAYFVLGWLSSIWLAVISTEFYDDLSASPGDIWLYICMWPLAMVIYLFSDDSIWRKGSDLGVVKIAEIFRKSKD